MSELVRAAHDLALRISPIQPISPAELTPFLENAIGRDELRALFLTLQLDTHALLPRDPRRAAALARLADEIVRARLDARTRADASLTLAIALNALGEFRAALAVAEQASTLGAELDDGESAARADCEIAWAHSFLGELERVSEPLARARRGLAETRARADWIEGRICRERGAPAQAHALLERARDAFRAAGQPLDAARCERELAHTFARGERAQALALLERVRAFFQSADCPVDVGLCDWVMGAYWETNNAYATASERFRQCRQRFADLGMNFFVAQCDNSLGICQQHLNHLDEALAHLRRARDYFAEQQARVEMSACNINIGNVYYALNRYDEALTSYRQAEELVQGHGRAARQALIWMNIGCAYAKQGRYAQAVDHLERARQRFVDLNLPARLALCHSNLASAYRQLGQSARAVGFFEQARAEFVQSQLHEYRMECDIELADLYLAQDDAARAAEYLEEASRAGAENQLEVLTALSQRLLAQIIGARGERGHARKALAQCRAVFQKHSQRVDLALCDLAEGDLRLGWGALQRARICYMRARAILFPSFPDHAWRAEYGLGRCAHARGDAADALAHFLSAVRAIGDSRAGLGEELSNSYFAVRAAVYDAALATALNQRDPEAALEIIETGKARAFLAQVQTRDWKLPRGADAYIAELIAREKQLRYQLAALRRRSVLQNLDAGEVLRGGAELAAISAAALAELNATSQAYEAVVTQLRLAANGLAGVSAPAPFSLEKFRAAMHAAYGDDWCALDYWLDEESVVIATLTARNVNAQRRALSAFDRAILEQCANPDVSVREWVYRQSNAVDTPGFKYLRHLYRLLIPDTLRARTLVIAPHRTLHTLPFHALRSEKQFLVEQSAIVYAPSLQVLQHLLQARAGSRPEQPLALGVTQFGGVMPALPDATAEVEALRRVFQTRGEYLLDASASRQRLFELNAAGKLREFAVLHFATHAILDRAAPHQSRVLLADEPLTVTDILDLDLDAQLVVLSACQTVLGQGGAGDEWIGLARAFFYAGARGLLATLWHVEDRTTRELIARFYRHWASAPSIAHALQRAQVEMIEQGASPHHWAAFVGMGSA